LLEIRINFPFSVNHKTKRSADATINRAKDFWLLVLGVSKKNETAGSSYPAREECSGIS
jgi:hypothetical protein